MSVRFTLSYKEIPEVLSNFENLGGLCARSYKAEKNRRRIG